MHITSNITSTKSIYDIPVIILAFSDAEGSVHSRKFVSRPLNYHDLVVTARKIFHFDNDAILVFGTSTLDVCRGTWIEIDESAYESLFQCLDEVVVRHRKSHEDIYWNQTDKGTTLETDRVVDANPISEHTSGPTMPEKRLPDTPTLATGGSNAFAPSAPSRHGASIRAESTTNQLSSSPITEQEAPKSTQSRLLTQLDEMSKQKSKPLSQTRERKPEPQPEPARELGRAAEVEIEEKKLKPKFKPASASHKIQKLEPEPLLRLEPQKARQRKPNPVPEPTREDEIEDEDAWHHAHPSDAITEEILEAGLKDNVEDQEDEDFWRFGTKSVGPSSGSSRKREPVPRPTISPASNLRLTKTGSTDSVEAKKEAEEKKNRDTRAKLSTVSATHLPRASARPLAHFKQDPNQRFMVTVHGPRVGQGADFRTRGGHKIKKVLESACKTFKLPYECSHLILEQDTEDATHYYCDPEETVGVCGIDTDARLLVQVDGVTDEELIKYGEEEEEDR